MRHTLKICSVNFRKNCKNKSCVALEKGGDVKCSIRSLLNPLWLWFAAGGGSQMWFLGPANHFQTILEIKE